RPAVASACTTKGRAAAGPVRSRVRVVAAPSAASPSTESVSRRSANRVSGVTGAWLRAGTKGVRAVTDDPLGTQMSPSPRSGGVVPGDSTGAAEQRSVRAVALHEVDDHRSQLGAADDQVGQGDVALVVDELRAVDPRAEEARGAG